MASIWSKLRKSKPEQRIDQNDWASQYMGFNNNYYPISSMSRSGNKQEQPDNDFGAYVRGAYKSHGPIFACCMARMTVFTEIRFVWQKIAAEGGRPGDLTRTDELRILERPWRNGNTSDLLARAIQDVDMCGNHYVIAEGVGDNRRLRRLRPDWVDIVLTESPDQAVESDVAGYVYRPGGTSDPDRWVLYPADGSNGAIAHWAPIPDPEAMYRGMSWITPVLREMMSDKAATEHKLKFFENAAPQPLDAKILTPRGWSTMGEMLPGSEVIGSDGHPHRVAEVLPQGKRAIYRVTFNDGTWAESTADHLWQVSNSYDRKLNRSRTMTLQEIADSVQHDCGVYRWSVQNVDPIQYAVGDDLPLDPYALGVLLGDGCFGGASVSCASNDRDVQELEEAFSAALPSTVQIRTRSRRGNGSEIQFSRAKGSDKENWLKGRIRELGLDKALHDQKFVPEMYMRAGVKDRLAVLQGLIDTDGSVQGASVRFTTTSQVLAEQVAELCLSLGGNATVVPTPRSGENVKLQWTVHIRRLPDWAVPCRLSRKVSAYRPAERVGRYRTIVGVEYIRDAEAQCIRVESSDSLYVTNGMVLTHNCPNIAVSLKETVTEEQFRQFMETMNETKHGIDHVYETLYLGGGADVKVIGADMKQMDFRAVQGLSETRVAAAARVPAIIAGFSEGLQGSSLNQGNFQAAKDQFGDATLRPLWRSLCSAYEDLVPHQKDMRLWYDDREIPFLRQDRKEVADIQSAQSRAIGYLIMQGYTPDSIVESVVKEDYTLLEHTGLYSVQLIPPGASAPSGTGQDKHNDPSKQEGAPDANKVGQQSKPGDGKPNSNKSYKQEGGNQKGTDS